MYSNIYPFGLSASPHKHKHEHNFNHEPMFTGRRITICPIEATNCYAELTRFEVDTAMTSLRDVVERIHKDPMLHCKTARVGTKLLTYEDDVTGDPIDMFNPAVGLEPLAAIVPHLLPRAASNGLTEFAEGQELWLVVDGCATELDAIAHIGSELLLSKFDAIQRKKEDENEVVARQKESAAVRTLLEVVGSMCARASPDAAVSALETACHDKKQDVVSFLVGAIPKTNPDGGGPLHTAAAGGHIHSATLFVREHDAKVNAKDDSGRTPLHVAARHGQVSFSRQLLWHFGADANVVDKNGFTPLYTAAQYGHAYFVSSLALVLSASFNIVVDSGSSSIGSPLHTAAWHGHADAVRVYAKVLRHDVNVRGATGAVPLHFAAMKGHSNVARVLVKELGADVNSKTLNGSTPLHLAVINGHVEFAQLLVEELGADTKIEDRNRMTALEQLPLSKRGAFEFIYRVQPTRRTAPTNSKLSGFHRRAL